MGGRARAGNSSAPSEGSASRAALAGEAPELLVLLVGCPADFVAVCYEAGGKLAVAVQDCGLEALRATASAGRPFAIIVMEELYRCDPEVFDAVSRGRATSLVRLDADEVRGSEAQRLLAEAVLEAAASDLVSSVRPAIY
jgi:hypothetical protein